MSIARTTHKIGKRFGTTNPLNQVPYLRGAIAKEIAAERYSISDAFRTYTWKTIPQMEEQVEEEIIGGLIDKMESEVLREELLQAYKRRRMKIESLNLDEDR